MPLGPESYHGQLNHGWIEFGWNSPKVRLNKRSVLYVMDKFYTAASSSEKLIKSAYADCGLEAGKPVNIDKVVVERGPDIFRCCSEEGKKLSCPESKMWVKLSLQEYFRLQ